MAVVCESFAVVIMLNALLGFYALLRFNVPCVESCLLEFKIEKRTHKGDDCRIYMFRNNFDPKNTVIMRNYMKPF